MPVSLPRFLSDWLPQILPQCSEDCDLCGSDQLPHKPTPDAADARPRAIARSPSSFICYKQRPGTPPHGPGSEPENSRGNMEKQRPMLVFLLARPPQIGKVQSLKNRGFLLCTELSALPCLPESLRRLRWFARDSASTRHPVRTCVEPVCCDGENCVCSILFRCIILFRNSGRFGLPGSQAIRHSPTDRRRH